MEKGTRRASLFPCFLSSKNSKAGSEVRPVLRPLFAALLRFSGRQRPDPCSMENFHAVKVDPGSGADKVSALGGSAPSAFYLLQAGGDDVVPDQIFIALRLD